MREAERATGSSCRQDRLTQFESRQVSVTDELSQGFKPAHNPKPESPELSDEQRHGNKPLQHQTRLPAGGRRRRHAHCGGQYPWKLPSERHLAEEFGVSYITMRHAMAILRERGLIVSIHGRGTFNSSALTEDPTDPLPTGGIQLLLLNRHGQVLLSKRPNMGCRLVA